ncbi:MAG: response regulator [Flavobacteriales bacterium]|nr:Sensor histidine kinase RcsC [Flavobacteriales bacterium]MCC6578241.1 response regulator [Flavobacteriales bacterium]
MSSSARTPWHRSIATRTVAGLVLLVSCAALLAGYLVYSAVREQVQRTVRRDLRLELDLADLRLRGFTTTLADDIVFLGTNDPVTALASDSTGDSLARAATLERVALLLESFMRSRPAYFQVRLLDADSLGMERIRFDRVDGRVRRMADSALQAKGDRDYYREALALGPGKNYFSRIDLNQEHGTLSLPLTPTLRAARVLPGRDGKPMGMVVINADLRPLFAELLGRQRPGSTLVLMRPDGEIVLHPDSAVTFRSEFGQRPPPASVLGVPTIADSTVQVQDRFWAFRDLRGTPLPQALRLGLGMDTAPLLAEMGRRRDRAVALTLGIALAFTLLALLLARGLLVRLARITAQVERYAAGGGGEDLPTDRADEVGRLARSLQRMQRRIDERVLELQHARRAAEEADRMRREVTANLSHDVRTPLQAILGMADGIDRSTLRPEDRDRMAVIDRSARRLHGLVDDLLLHARIEADREVPHGATVDLVPLFTDIARAHLPTAKDKGLALRLDLAQAPAHFVTDPLHLHRIVDNLVSNAVKYTVQGQVDVRVGLAGGDLRIDVSDSGPGIPADRQDAVFLRFERARSDDGPEGGAGLGLAITRRLVELLGGGIALESSPGAGSRFTVLLPPLRPATAEAPVAAPPEGTERGLHVLHVDDVATNRELMAQWATALGWTLIACSGSAEALAACDAHTFDLMLIDVDLGGDMRGTELAMRLRGLRRHRYTPMLAVTAFADAALEAEALKAGLNARLVKPIDRPALVAAAAFWTGRWNGPCTATPRLDVLEAQYDHDAEKLLRVMTQYRREMASWRADVLRAMDGGEGEVLRRVRHKLRPHLELFGMADAAAALANAEGTADARTLLGLMACCDRSLLLRQAGLAATAGPGAA